MRLRVVKVGSNPVRKTAPATAMAIPIHACGRIDSCRKTWANMATKTGAVYVMASECAVLVNPRDAMYEPKWTATRRPYIANFGVAIARKLMPGPAPDRALPRGDTIDETIRIVAAPVSRRQNVISIGPTRGA